MIVRTLEAFELDQFLLTINHIQKTIVIKSRNIAGLEPSIARQSLLCCFWVTDILSTM
jgi:hypothetical protein